MYASGTTVTGITEGDAAVRTACDVAKAFTVQIHADGELDTRTGGSEGVSVATRYESERKRGQIGARHGSRTFIFERRDERSHHFCDDDRLWTKSQSPHGFAQWAVEIILVFVHSLADIVEQIFHVPGTDVLQDRF